VTTIGADRDRQLSTLEMAQNLAASVHRYARQSKDDQLGSYLNQTGERAHAAAQLAANLATVSIAEDVHRIVAVMLGQVPATLAEEAGLDPDDPVIAQARATREHMRNWGAGEETHKGEGTL
jgi:hypothetical protein